MYGILIDMINLRWNWKVLAIVLIFGGVFLLFFIQTSEPTLPTNGTNVVVFGDSLAEGVGADRGKDIASLLSVKIGREVLNLGVSGNITADGLARINTLIESDPKVVIILLGGNDAIRRIPVEETFLNLTRIIEKVNQTGAAVILVAEPGGLYGNQYEKEYERLATEYKTFYVPNILSGIIGRPELMSDYIHPNSAGYEMVVEKIEPVLREALDESK